MATYKTMDDVLREEAVKLIVLARKSRAQQVQPVSMSERLADLLKFRDDVLSIADAVDDWCFHSPECSNGDTCVAGEEGANERRVRMSNEQAAAEERGEYNARCKGCGGILTTVPHDEDLDEPYCDGCPEEPDEMTTVLAAGRV